MIKSIDWIFFDIGGVIGDESDFQSIREQYDLQAAQSINSDIVMSDIRNVWRQASSMIGDLDENVLSLCVHDEGDLQEAVQRMRAFKDSSPRYYDVLRIRPEAKEVLSRLAQTYKLGLMANQGKEVKDILSKYGILEYFCSTSVSVDHSLSKPNPAFYEAILHASGTNPLRSAMVDDNIERGLIPAKNLDMKTIWYRLQDRPIPDGSVDVEIGSLKDLLNVSL